MFEGDLGELSTADLLESAAEHRAEANRIDARVLEHAQIYADRFHPDACPHRPGRRSHDGRERAVILGGDGCPPIAEFAIAEFGVLLGISPRVAAGFIGQALALRHRFPFTWARVQAGDATPWKAHQIAATCTKLSEAAAGYVDRRVAPLVDSITPYRLDKIVRAAKKHADPGLAQAEADQNARERGVYVGRSDEHGTKTLYIRAGAGAVNRHHAMLTSIADALKVFGDTRSLQSRCADAVGIIADPLYTQELLTQAGQHPSTTPATHPPRQALDDDLLEHDRTRSVEPSPHDQADREAPYPSDVAVPDPLDAQHGVLFEPFDLLDAGDGDGRPMSATALRALHARLVQIKHDAHTGRTSGRLRPGHTEIYVHLTDHTLATGTGVLRADGIGPLLASQLTELVGHGPYTVKPVIDINDAISVDAYEIPDRIRERIRLAQPVEVFPFGTRETTRTMDLDHIEPYDALGPPGQTNTHNLAPLGRFTHRVKTHARGWNVRRLDHKTLEWTTPHGFVFEVGPTGTVRVPGRPGYSSVADGSAVSSKPSKSLPP